MSPRRRPRSSERAWCRRPSIKWAGAGDPSEIKRFNPGRCSKSGASGSSVVVCTIMTLGVNLGPEPWNMGCTEPQEKRLQGMSSSYDEQLAVSLSPQPGSKYVLKNTS